MSNVYVQVDRRDVHSSVALCETLETQRIDDPHNTVVRQRKLLSATHPTAAGLTKVFPQEHRGHKVRVLHPQPHLVFYLFWGQRGGIPVVDSRRCLFAVLEGDYSRTHVGVGRRLGPGSADSSMRVERVPVCPQYGKVEKRDANRVYL